MVPTFYDRRARRMRRRTTRFGKACSHEPEIVLNPLQTDPLYPPPTPHASEQHEGNSYK